MIITYILLAYAGLSASVMWTIQFRWERSVFAHIKEDSPAFLWFSPLGWRLKYKDQDPKKGPAFPGSTTIFVFLTDAFHFFQFIFYTSIDLAFALQLCGGDVAMVFVTLTGIKACRGLFFELGFKYFLTMKFYKNFRSNFIALFAAGPRAWSIVTIGLGFGLLVWLDQIPRNWGTYTVIGLTCAFIIGLFIHTFFYKQDGSNNT